MYSVCVYCGSGAGTDPAYARAAQSLGHALAARGMALVYGGGKVGLMGVVADAALAGGARVMGAITERLVEREVAHTGLTALTVVQTMHQRKQAMADIADGFITMPGGLGTLEELFETWTWRQLGYHNKPLGLLNVQGYFDPLLDFLAQGHETGFIKATSLAPMIVDDDPARLLDRMAASHPPAGDPWWIMREKI